MKSVVLDPYAFQFKRDKVMKMTSCLSSEMKLPSQTSTIEPIVKDKD